ncbi:MAG TPA: hypothetical protein VFE55_14830 [Acidimicrobiia bacterium]|nr:hypothetical protein [Acidimicrobiia bacterium]
MRGTIGRIGVTGAGALLAIGLFAAGTPAGASPSGGHGVNSADSTCFTATGQTQGRSHSDPDGMSNGGADKPGCTGGFDSDRDGNNGCGNDADREDDNNGNCGRQKDGRGHQGSGGAPAPTTTSSTTTTTTAPATVTPTVEPGAVELTDCQVDPKEATDCPATAQSSGTGAHLSAAAPADTATAGTDVGAATAGTGATGPAAEAGTAGTVSAAPTTAPGTEVLGETLTRPGTLARTGAGVGALSLLGLGLCGSGRLAVLARRLLRIG